MKPITITPYNPAWPGEFNKIKTELTQVLQGVALAIEHVGSTAVPGLSAKPIIDIDIIIETENFSATAARLATIGYHHVGDLGITGREAFKYEGKPHLMEHHLYVCEKNSPELNRHISLRDFLRTNETYRNKYSQIKIEMAKKFPHDIDSYIEGKQPLILKIYQLCGLDITYKAKDGSKI
ncbi:MAG: GrpB family protein [Defluviitaleaceae bacterium]|nr:GrpB family protein [Defluviitaleaceae bacterium]